MDRPTARDNHVRSALISNREKASRFVLLLAVLFGDAFSMSATDDEGIWVVEFVVFRGVGYFVNEYRAEDTVAVEF